MLYNKGLMRAIRILCFDGSAAYVDAAVFSLGPEGVELQIIDPRFSASIEPMMEGVYSRPMGRSVRPDEGELFLNALNRELAVSTYTRAVPID